MFGGGMVAGGPGTPVAAQARTPSSGFLHAPLQLLQFVHVKLPKHALAGHRLA